ncbi:MAG: flagellar biosynthesis protein FlhB [Phycisphaerales bacterium]|nr:flagellar biosynthesis protein FlhB [Phycisphaerales bacterium]
MDDLGEKTEAPTAKKRSSARQKGQVPKSQDLSGIMSMLGMLIVMIVFGGYIFEMFARVMRRTLSGDISSSLVSTDTIWEGSKYAVIEMAYELLPIMGVSFVLVYIVQFLQVGWLIAPEQIRPKFSKLSPIAGIKRTYGKRGLIKTILNTIKLVILVVVASLVIRSHLDDIMVLPKLAPMIAVEAILRLVITLSFILIALLLLLALFDFIYQRWQHTEELKMTKQEVKDERKTMEGDPLIKGRRMQLARQIVMQQIGNAVPDADVIVTNPTHFSVAIKYDTETMNAPRVVAKGADLIAMRIRQIARENDVPIVERPPLARAMYWGIEVGQEISTEHYEAVAELLAYVYKIDGRMPPRAEHMNQSQPQEAVGV